VARRRPPLVAPVGRRSVAARRPLRRRLARRHRIAFLQELGEGAAHAGGDRRLQLVRQIRKSGVGMERVQIAQQGVRHAFRPRLHRIDGVDGGGEQNLLHQVGRGFLHNPRFSRSAAWLSRPV
jgi:hypothetical protein